MDCALHVLRNVISGGCIIYVHGSKLLEPVGE